MPHVTNDARRLASLASGLRTAENALTLVGIELGHNAYDLVGMREVLRRATAEMADASGLVAV